MKGGNFWITFLQLFRGDLNFGAFSFIIDNFSYCLDIQMLAGDRLLSQTLKSRALISINWSYFSKAYFLPITTWNDSITSFLHGQHGILDNYANFFSKYFFPQGYLRSFTNFWPIKFFLPQFRGFDNWHLCFV